MLRQQMQIPPKPIKSLVASGREAGRHCSSEPELCNFERVKTLELGECTTLIGDVKTLQL